MPTGLQREAFITWLNLQLAGMGLDSLYSTYLVSMLEKGGDAGYYLKTVADGVGTVPAKDVEVLVNELGQRWYGYDDEGDDILSLSQGCSPAAFIDDYDDDDDINVRKDSSTGGTLTPILAPSSAVRQVLTPFDPWRNDDSVGDKVVDIFGSKLSFDVLGLSATAKEFTPGSVGSEEPRYLRGESSASRIGSYPKHSGISFSTPEKHMKNTDFDENEPGFSIEDYCEYGTADSNLAEYYSQNSNAKNGLFEIDEFETTDDNYNDQDLETEMVNYLGANFPECGEECLLMALRKADFDMEHAGEMIHSAFANAAERNHKQPCRHFISGECLRRDCMFSHDFATTVCRYWLQGMCRNGAHCLFVHDLDPVLDVNDPLHHANIEGELFVNDMAISKKGAFHGVLAEEFPALSMSLPKSPTFLCGSSGTLSPTGKSFASVVGTSPQPQAPTRRELPGDYRRTVGGKVRNSSSFLEANSWVQTGETVSGQYRQARGEAAELARNRNSYFMGATQAYRRGDAKEAKNLAAKGREINRQMKDRHRLAARYIYEARNPRQQVLERGALDLHGLHVAEATALLEEELPGLCQAGLRTVCLITGTGHHSRGSNYKARLLPAVERFCLEWGLFFERVVDKNGHVGMLHVTLSKDVLLGVSDRNVYNVNGMANNASEQSANQRTIIIR